MNASFPLSSVGPPEESLSLARQVSGYCRCFVSSFTESRAGCINHDQVDSKTSPSLLLPFLHSLSLQPLSVSASIPISMLSSISLFRAKYNFSLAQNEEELSPKRVITSQHARRNIYFSPVSPWQDHYFSSQQTFKLYTNMLKGQDNKRYHQLGVPGFSRLVKSSQILVSVLFVGLAVVVVDVVARFGLVIAWWCLLLLLFWLPLVINGFLMLLVFKARLSIKSGCRERWSESSSSYVEQVLFGGGFYVLAWLEHRLEISPNKRGSLWLDLEALLSWRGSKLRERKMRFTLQLWPPFPLEQSTFSVCASRVSSKNPKMINGCSKKTLCCVKKYRLSLLRELSWLT